MLSKIIVTDVTDMPPPARGYPRRGWGSVESATMILNVDYQNFPFFLTNVTYHFGNNAIFKVLYSKGQEYHILPSRNVPFHLFLQCCSRRVQDEFLSNSRNSLQMNLLMV